MFRKLDDEQIINNPEFYAPQSQIFRICCSWDFVENIAFP
jgi:hypothetical protein